MLKDYHSEEREKGTFIYYVSTKLIWGLKDLNWIIFLLRERLIIDLYVINISRLYWYVNISQFVYFWTLNIGLLFLPDL